MRAIVSLLALVVILGIIGVATGFFKFSATPGEMPKIAVSGGSLPRVSADAGSISLGSRNEAVSVPEVKVATKQTSVEVPTVAVRKPD
ncbi:hypothetical protein [Sphingomonas sp.]|uniref:hypothetical protein n=1 Tax=Sphingomonas sp. TaxID=28214 RepID=UPI0025D2905B|nr:hypothetical protein [Sphingomonas sp.]